MLRKTNFRACYRLLKHCKSKVGLEKFLQIHYRLPMSVACRRFYLRTCSSFSLRSFRGSSKWCWMSFLQIMVFIPENLVHLFQSFFFSFFFFLSSAFDSSVLFTFYFYFSTFNIYLIFILFVCVYVLTIICC